MFIDRNDIHEDRVHEFSVCASDLGLAPGQFPSCLETNAGNGQPFVRDALSNSEAVTYHQMFGCIKLTIFND